MGKGGRRIIPQTGGRKRDTVKERHKGAKEEKNRKDMAREEGQRKTFPDVEELETQIWDL